MMNSDLTKRQPYPVKNLQQQEVGVQPLALLEPVALSTGEPVHSMSAAIAEAVLSHLQGLFVCPMTKGFAAEYL